MSLPEQNVQLPVDSTDNKNKIRMLEIELPDPDGNGDITTVLQEVVALGDEFGNLLSTGPLGDTKLAVEVQSEILEELRRINKSLGFLGLLLMQACRPDDAGHEISKWINKTLGGGHHK